VVASIISTNDVLVGLLWRAIVKARHLPEGKQTRFGMAVDGRQRDLGIPVSYAGCANYYASWKTDARALVDGSLADAALLVRKALLQIEKKTVADWVSIPWLL